MRIPRDGRGFHSLRRPGPALADRRAAQGLEIAGSMTQRALVSRTTMEVATALATAAIGAAVLWGSVEHDIGWGDSGPAAGYFPFRIGALIMLASLVNIGVALWHRRTDL